MAASSVKQVERHRSVDITSVAGLMNVQVWQDDYDGSLRPPDEIVYAFGSDRSAAQRHSSQVVTFCLAPRSFQELQLCTASVVSLDDEVRPVTTTTSDDYASHNSHARGRHLHIAYIHLAADVSGNRVIRFSYVSR